MQRTRSSQALALAAALALTLPACNSDDPAETTGDAEEPGADTTAEQPEPLALELVAEDYEDGALLSVWGTGPDDVWIVGGESGQDVALHFDGAAWERRDPGVGEKLWWVHGFEDGPVFAVGDAGAVASYENGQWETYDVDLPGTTLYGVWGATPDDVWIVGGISLDAPTDEQEGDVVLHYDGDTFERVEIDALTNKPDSAQKNLFKVWGTDPDNVFIVGASGMALHYDGQTWRQEDTGLGNQILFTVAGRAADDVYAVGGMGVATLIHWDGASWSQVDLPPETPSIAQGVTTRPGEPVTISGLTGFVASQSEDGRWSIGEADTTDGFHAVWSDGEGALWAVGGDITTHQADHHGSIAVMGRDVPAP